MGEKLDPTMKAKWLAALRSGEYHQGVGTLCRVMEDDARYYCCLGVASHLLAQENPAYLEVRVGNSIEFGTAEMRRAGHMNTALPEDEVYRGWIGLSNTDPSVNLTTEELAKWSRLRDEPEAEGGLSYRCLSSLNDAGFSFAEIANIIEREL